MLGPANFSVIESLRDGRQVEIRAQRPQDRKALQAALTRMSDESLYRRFFVARHHFSDKEVEYFLDIDFVNHVAVVAVADEDGKRAIVGAARYVVVQPGQAEVAFGVVDEYQGQRLGSGLMRHLSGIARHAGVKELIADVLAENVAMLKVFERSGLQMSTNREGPTVHLALKLT